MPNDNYTFVQVHEVATGFFGLCYTVEGKSRATVNSNFLLTIKFNHDIKTLRNIDVFLHEPAERFSVIIGQWLSGEVLSLEAWPGYYHSLIFTKLIKNKNLEAKNGRCMHYKEGESQIKCISKQMALIYLKDKKSKCMVPMLETILTLTGTSYKDIIQCTTREDMLKTMRSIFTMKAQNRNANSFLACKPQCVETYYKMPSVQKNSMTSGTEIIFNMRYGNTGVYTMDEYLLFDTIAIVAAVGGTLGLFIGFSFYDCIAAIINYF